MQSAEAPTASSKTHSSTGSMPGRKSELSMYGDLLQNAWELATEQDSTGGSPPRLRSLERATHKVVAASAPQAKVIQARQADRHRKEKGPDERGRFLSRVLLSSGALADFVGNELAGHDQPVDAVAGILLVGNVVGDAVSDELVRGPEDAGQRVPSFPDRTSSLSTRALGRVSTFVMLKSPSLATWMRMEGRPQARAASAISGSAPPTTRSGVMRAAGKSTIWAGSRLMPRSSSSSACIFVASRWVASALPSPACCGSPAAGAV